MADVDPRPRPSADVVEPGIPATEDVPEEQLLTGDTKDVGDMPMPDQPMGSASWGTTADEERRGEPLEVRVLQEEPDVVGGGDTSAAGQLYEPGAEGGVADTEATLVADEEAPGDAPTAEEAAMHVTDSPGGLNYDDDPGYVED